MYVHTYIHIYIYREREIHVYIYIYIYTRMLVYMYDIICYISFLPVRIPPRAARGPLFHNGGRTPLSAETKMGHHTAAQPASPPPAGADRHLIDA